MTPEEKGAMTPEEALAFIKDQAKGLGDLNIETLMAAMQLWVEADRKAYVESFPEDGSPNENGERLHDVVLACIDGCIENLQAARMDYYCSTK